MIFVVAFAFVVQETVAVLVFSLLALPSFFVVVADVVEQLLAVLAAVLQLVAAVAWRDVLAVFDVPTFFDQPCPDVVVVDVGFVAAVGVANVDVGDVAADTLAVAPDVGGHKC